MKVVFIADFLRGDNSGGAELNDSTLVEFLITNNYLFKAVRSHEVTSDFIKDNKEKVFIVSNFANLSTHVKALLYQKCKYIIYEHDYKFMRCRNPVFFPEFKSPFDEFTNLNFFRGAHRLVCLSKLHKDIFELNTDIENIENIRCSLYSEEQLELLGTLNKKEKTKEYAVIKSSDPRKRTQDAIQFCVQNKLDYEVISAKDNNEFLTLLNEFKNLVFMAGHPEPTPRTIMEAKMLNINVISQKRLIGISYEDWFSLNGDALIKEVRDMRESAFNMFKRLIESD
jgi:hypothetical protein